MTEGTPAPELNLTPEYWDGHSNKDNCPQAVGALNKLLDYPKIERYTRELAKRIKGELEKYSILEETFPIPLARFEKGSTFVPDSYPHGTLIRVTSETLNLSPSYESAYRYDNTTALGIVVDTSGISLDGKDRNAIAYISGPSLRVLPGEIDEVAIGVVEHRKIAERFLNIESLWRKNSVEIILMGGGGKKRVEHPAGKRKAILGIPLPHGI